MPDIARDDYEGTLRRELDLWEMTSSEVLHAASTAARAEDRKQCIEMLTLAFIDELDEEQRAETVDRLLEISSEDERSQVRRAALWSATTFERSERVRGAILAAIDETDLALARNDLLLMLDNQDWNDDVRELLRDIFVDESRHNVERSAVAALWGSRKAVEEIPHLIDALDPDDIELAFWAAEALARMGRSEGIELLEDAAGDEASDPTVAALLNSMRRELEKN